MKGENYIPEYSDGNDTLIAMKIAQGSTLKYDSSTNVPWSYSLKYSDANRKNLKLYN